MRKSKSFVALALLPLAGLLACNNNNNEDQILPVRASLTIQTVNSDPAVFFQASALDTSTDDNMVVLDVMLRSGAAVNFEAITLEITFDPGLAQIAQIDANTTPLGDCTSSNACAPLCLNNVVATQNAPSANSTGDLIIGVAAKPLCPTGNAGTVKLMTLGFLATTVGSSAITLVDGAGPGDCEILHNGNSLAIPCDSGGATIVGFR